MKRLTVLLTLAVFFVAANATAQMAQAGKGKPNPKPPKGEVIYSGFGVGDTYYESSGHHVSMGEYGESDAAAAFTVPIARSYLLLSMEVAVGLLQGANELDVCLLGSRMGTDVAGNDRPEPDESNVIEYFRVSGGMGSGGILKINSATTPTLDANTQYWVVMSTPVYGSYVMWFTAALELEGGPGQYSAQREDNGAWNVAFSSLGARTASSASQRDQLSDDSAPTACRKRVTIQRQYRREQKRASAAR